jgi:hypothetical protein
MITIEDDEDNILSGLNSKNSHIIKMIMVTVNQQKQKRIKKKKENL